MARVAVIGEAVRVSGFALAGAQVLAAETAQEARAAWGRLTTDVAVAVLTPRAAAWLAEPDGGDTATPPAPQHPGPLVVVMPP